MNGMVFDRTVYQAYRTAAWREGDLRWAQPIRPARLRVDSLKGPPAGR